MSNYPDDCQGSGQHLPWNEPEDEPYCKVCDEPISDDDEYDDMCDKCVKEEDDE